MGLALLANMVAHARSFKEHRDAHLTFHLGDDRSWRHKTYADYDHHNTAELLNILATLERKVGPFGPDTIPGSFLLRLRWFGPLYEAWARYVRLPIGLSRWLNSVVRRTS